MLCTRMGRGLGGRGATCSGPLPALTLFPKERGEGMLLAYLKLLSTISGANPPPWNERPVSMFETVTAAGENSIGSIL